MKVETKKEGDVVVFSLHGSVRMPGYSVFPSNMKKLLKNEASKKIILDCAKLNYINSTGLEGFITVYKHALENEVMMVVCGLQDTVSYVFDVTGFKDLINVCQNKEEAIRLLND